MSTQRSVRTRLTLDVNDYLQGTAQAENATKRFGGSAAGVLKGVATGYAAIKLGGLITESVQLEATYSKTMAQVAVATEAPAAQLEKLDDLALKLGADTVFSAGDAAQAMLELAKGGLTPAQISAGALANTLTLASAGGLELGVAANTVVQAMGAFQLGAEDTAAAVAALAGAANASSADVSDITQALQQAGTSANAAGFSIQDTAAYLGLFADSGIKGSDAGTSLRTMLTRLVPQTKEADAAMKALGLTYVDGNGKLVSATEIAKRTQDAFSGLSDEQRITYGNAIFGADAQRAVNVLTSEGEEGLKKYQTATQDLTQAQKLADAANSGTAGALEQLSGAVETAQIEIGKGLAPVVQDMAAKASDLVEGGDIEGWATSAGEGVASFFEEIAPLAVSLGGLARESLPAVAAAGKVTIEVLELAADIITPLVDGFNKLPDAAQQALILAAGAKTLSNRLGPIPGLAGPAGSSLFAFGGQAKKGGEDAGAAAPKYASLLSSLKGFALLTAASYALPNLASATDDAFNAYDASNKDFSKSFDAAGRANAKTVESIGAAFQDGAIGKYADDLGVNLDTLAKDFATSGIEGDYVKTVLAEMESQYSATKDALRDPFESIIGKGESDKIASVRNALEDLSDEYDKAQEKARAQALSVDENRNAFDLIVNGLGQYSEELKGLPTRAVTQILTPGAVKGKTDILALAEAYDLTPEQVETIMKALDFASPKIREVRKALREADRDSATVTLTTYQDTIKRSFTEDQGKNGPGVDAFNKPRGGYTGLQIPAGYFGGGIVPGTPPSDPTRDNIFAMGANTGQPLMVRSGEWIINEQSSRENDRWLAMINQGLRLDDIIPGFAAGDRYDAFSELTASSALDLARQQQRIREINRSLKATESYGKGKNKRKRLVLKLGSQDRKVAELELKDAQDQLARMRNENKELRNYGTDAQESELRDRENAKQDAIDKAAEVAARQREAVASASGSITGGASLSGISSAAGLERRLNQVVADSAAFTQVIDALTRAGASQLVLDILKKEGPSKASIRVGRQLLADTARLARVNVTSASLTSIGQAYGDLTAGVGTLTSAQSTTLLQITTTDISQLSGEIARQVDHRLSTQATGAGV